MSQAFSGARSLAIFWRSELAALRGAGQVSGARRADGRLLGVAAWVPPGEYPLPAVAQGRALVGGSRAMILSPSGMWAGLRYLMAIDKVHPREPLWYLLLLVVDPSVQRSGIGTRLHGVGFDLAQEEGLDCYLETQNWRTWPTTAVSVTRWSTNSARCRTGPRGGRCAGADERLRLPSTRRVAPAYEVVVLYRRTARNPKTIPMAAVQINEVMTRDVVD
jgi:GNAT superfamily N-acetyltransferase